MISIAESQEELLEVKYDSIILCYEIMQEEYKRLYKCAKNVFFFKGEIFYTNIMLCHKQLYNNDTSASIFQYPNVWF